MSSGNFTILTKDFAGNERSVNINPSSTIFEIKECICQQLWGNTNDVDNIELSYRGKYLRDSNDFEIYNIPEYDRICIIVSVRGD